MDPLHEVVRSAQLLRRVEELLVAKTRDPRYAIGHASHVADGLHDVPGPGLSLGADHCGAFGDTPKRLTQIATPAHERNRELPLVHVVLLIGGRQYLGLVDVIDSEGLQHLGLNEVTDAALGHDRDAHGVDYLCHLVWIGHAGDTTRRTDVGGDTLERHDRDRSGVFGDLGLFSIDDVHDHAALEHLGQAGLHSMRADLSTILSHVGCAPFGAKRAVASAPVCVECKARLYPRPRPRNNRTRHVNAHTTSEE